MHSARKDWSLTAARRSERLVSAPAEQRPPPVLTRREARVRRILLRELERMNEWRRLTYSEKQHLERRLNVDWIDDQLARMRKQIRWSRRFRNVVLPFVLAMFGYGVVSLLTGTPFEGAHITMLFSPFYVLGPIIGIRSLQRKTFIYEALRELSDADEVDVVLDRSIRDADDLIRRVVDRELEIERRFPLRATFVN